MDFKVIWSPTARLDLKNLVSYIAEDDLQIAERFGEKIVEVAEQVGHFPFSGRQVPELHMKNLRELIFHAYRIVYRVREDAGTVEIARIWHAARGVPEIKA